MPGFPCRLLASRGACVSILLVAVLIAEGAEAQSRSAEVVLDAFMVDAVGNATAACGGGGGSGNALTTALNELLDNPTFDDEGVSIENRRHLYRLCDSLTTTGANGWTGDFAALPADRVEERALLLVPEEVFSGVDVARSVFDLQAGNIEQRIFTMRLARRDHGGEDIAAVRMPSGQGAGPFLASATTLQPVLQLFGGPRDDDDGLGFGLFVMGQAHWLDGDGNAIERESETSGGGFTFGGDLFVTDSILVGAALGYARADTDFDGTSSSSDMRAYSGSLYAWWQPIEHAYLRATFVGSDLSYDVTNEVVLLDGAPEPGDFSGDADGQTLGGAIEAGYTFAPERLAGLALEPSARVQFLETQIDAFTLEGGDGTLDTRIDDQEVFSTTLSLGLRLEYAIELDIALITPYFDADWVHEFEDETDDLSFTIAGVDAAGGDPFELEAKSVDRDYLTLGGGIGMNLASTLFVFSDYLGVFEHSNVELHRVTAGLRLAF